jgi:pyrimidine-specific ribonucleoside hydrolase
VTGRQASAAEQIAVWLDVDTSTGVVRERPRDVDDGLAMIQVFNSPELDLRGVSICFGNADLAEAMPIATDIARRFGPAGLAIHSGAASKDDLGRETDATRALAAALRESPLHVLALGPVTNVASVLKLHPELASRMQSIVVVAARRPGFNFHPPGRPELIFPDANFEKDVDGMQVLLDSGVPIVFAGYEVSADVWLTRADLEEIGARSEVGKWVRTTSDYWLTNWEQKHRLNGFNPFDTLGVAFLTHPSLIESIPVDVHISAGPNDRVAGRVPATKPTKAYLIAEPAKQAGSRFTYCVAAKPEFIPVLKARLAGKPGE